MNNRSRFAVACVALSLAVGGAVSGLLRRGTAPATPWSDFRLIPPTARLVASFEPRRLQSGGAEHLGAIVPLLQARFEATAGVPLASIDRIVMGVETSGDSRTPATGVLIVRGRFDKAAVDARFQAQGGRVESYRGQALYVSTGGSGDALASLAPGLLVFGDVRSVKAVVDRLPRSEPDPAVEELVHMVPGAERADVWVAGGTRALPWKTWSALLGGRLDAATAFAWSLRFTGETIDGSVRIDLIDDLSADSLRAFSRMATSVAMAAGSDGRLAVLKSAVVGGTGRTVTLTFVGVPALLGTADGGAPWSAAPR